MSTCVLGHGLSDGQMRCAVCGMGPLPVAAHEPALVFASATATEATAPPLPAAAVVSPDGRHYWSGSEWLAVPRPEDGGKQPLAAKHATGVPARRLSAWLRRMQGFVIGLWGH